MSGTDVPVFSGKHRLAPISLPLHEALGLCLLFQAAPPLLVQSLEAGGASYGLSAAYGYCRLREAIARLYDDEDSLTQVAAERAQLDQVSEDFA